jgi:O-antigen ligase
MKMGKKKFKQKPKRPLDLYFLILSSIILLPIIYSEKTLDMTLAPRLLGLGIIIGILLLYNFFKPMKDRPSLEFLKLTIFPLFLGLILWSVITVISSTTPAESLFDITKTLLSFLLLILATQVFIHNKKWINLLVKSVVIGSIAATSIGIYQYFELIPDQTTTNVFEALYDIKGFMSHKNQFAISLFLMFPFVVYGVFYLKKWWKVISIYAVVMIMINILLLQTRSVWIATIIFGLSLVILSGITLAKKQLVIQPGMRKKAYIIASGLLVVILLGGFIAQKTGALETLKFKATSIFDTDSHDNQGRLRIWESTLKLSKDHLLFGVGAGNWKLDIPPYFPYNYNLTYQNWRRPHNDYLWVLSEKGVIGLILYLLVFVLTIFYAIKVFIKEKDRSKLLFSSLIISGIAGYMAISFFTFPLERINHQIYLMIMMASIISIYYHNYPVEAAAKINKQYFKIHLVAIVLVTASIYYAWTLLQMELNIHNAIAYRNSSNWNKIIELSNKGFSKLTPIDAFSSPIHLHIGEADLKMKNYKQAKKDLEIAFSYSPNHISVLNNLAIVSAEMNNSQAAIDYLDYGLAIYPKYEASLFNKVNVYYRDKDYTNAYIALLSCNTKKKRGDYNSIMNVLTERVNTAK